ncbi:MAG: membrane protein insertase YidC [Rhodospirillum sp.]|nr:membrane protein insertase YidC [Rhodospirillum sp.]MCF8488909.1 membrane protein insertase YidC [Rhodospirillum sp.]MCF8500029.1 membrane protein insertase YidC [Rhodospirillum sp.]
MLEQRNLILAIVLSMAVLFGFEYFTGPKTPAPTQQAAETTTGAPTVPTPGAAPLAPGGTAMTPTAPGATAEQVATETRVQALASDSDRVTIDTASLHGSIRLKGGRIDDLTLVTYHETTDPTSPAISLLSPTGAPNPYYAEFGWVTGDKALKVPDSTTVWTASSKTLTESTPVSLTWDNGQGLRFTRRISVDAHYMFTIEQMVENTQDTPRTLYPYGLIKRDGEPKTVNFYILHEGPLGVFDGTLKEKKYSDLKDDGEIKYTTAGGGWLGITDKYWLTALAMDQDMPSNARFLYAPKDTTDGYQTDYTSSKAYEVSPGAMVQVTNRFFAGAKEVDLLDAYTDKLGITNFDLAIDFGWFYFLTKPFFLALQFLHGILGNMGLAILGFTVFLKALFFPLANKSYRSMSKMKLLQPEMKKLQERFKDDRQRLNTEMMALYKKEKVNPLAGCLPIVVQIPVFFALYKVLFVSIEMRHAPFYGWIKDLSAPDPTNIFTLFGLIPWDPPSMLMIGIWPVIMGITMFLQQKLNPAPADPTQAKIMMFLPLIFTFMLGHFAAGLVIYWSWNNSLSITQQWIIMRRMGAKP